MPYKIQSFGKGKAKICKKNGGKCFSKKPLPKKRALDPLRAIEVNTHNESVEPLWDIYFKPKDAPSSKMQVRARDFIEAETKAINEITQYLPKNQIRIEDVRKVSEKTIVKKSVRDILEETLLLELGGGIDATRQVVPTNPDKVNRCTECKGAGVIMTNRETQKKHLCKKCNGNGGHPQPIKESNNSELDSLVQILKVARGVMERNDPVEIKSFLENRGNSLQEYVLMLKNKIQQIDPQYFTHCGYCGRPSPYRTCHTCENELYGESLDLEEPRTQKYVWVHGFNRIMHNPHTGKFDCFGEKGFLGSKNTKKEAILFLEPNLKPEDGSRIREKLQLPPK